MRLAVRLMKAKAKQAKSHHVIMNTLHGLFDDILLLSSIILKSKMKFIFPWFCDR
jgi:hypothetical protein